MIYLTGILVFLINVMGLNAEKEILLAHSYADDFHVVFGMIATTILIFLIFLIISCTTIWSMDPGRDSIIYRMTSQKIKKDL